MRLSHAEDAGKLLGESLAIKMKDGVAQCCTVFLCRGGHLPSGNFIVGLMFRARPRGCRQGKVKTPGLPPQTPDMVSPMAILGSAHAAGALTFFVSPKKCKPKKAT